MDIVENENNESIHEQHESHLDNIISNEIKTDGNEHVDKKIHDDTEAEVIKNILGSKLFSHSPKTLLP